MRVKIIPVIDIKDGWVVQAHRGQREAYEPLRSPLSRDARPDSVVQGLMQLADFDTLYIADLDALMGKPPQTALIDGLRSEFPALNYWVDAGLAPFQRQRDGLSRSWRPVIGSESMQAETLAQLTTIKHPWILSLDYLNERFIGPEQLLTRPGLWPEWVILMKLSRVGSFEGPDFETTQHFISQFPGHRFVVAGGVRHPEDLDNLAGMGVSAVLVASALHAGTLDRHVLTRFLIPEAIE